MTTTEDIIDRAKTLLAGITPGEWEVEMIHNTNASVVIINKSIWIARQTWPKDAAFIAAAPELVRGLCEEVKRLRGERNRAKPPIQQKSVPDVPNAWLTVGGQSFSCKCGCKLFNQPDRNVKIYFCNSCGAEHEGFPL